MSGLHTILQCISQENLFNCGNTFFSYRRICHDQNTLARMLLLNHAAHKIKMGWRNSESSQQMVHFQAKELRHKRPVSYDYSKAWGPVLRKFPPIFCKLRDRRWCTCPLSNKGKTYYFSALQCDRNQRKTIVNSWVRCLENNQVVITSGFSTVNFRKW